MDKILVENKHVHIKNSKLQRKKWKLRLMFYFQNKSYTIHSQLTQIKKICFSISATDPIMSVIYDNFVADMP